MINAIYAIANPIKSEAIWKESEIKEIELDTNPPIN